MNATAKLMTIPFGVQRPPHVKNGEPFTVRMKLTPEIAEKWLKRNSMNRPLSNTNLSFLIHEMKNGRFHFNGESIQFDYDGRLQNGQHRCEAVVRSRCSIDTNVTIGLNPEVFHTLDTGKTRTAGDVLAIAGVPDYNTAAAIAKFIHQFERKRYTRIQSAKHVRLDHGQVLEFVEKTPDFNELVSFATRLYHKSGKFLPASIVGGLCFFMQKKHKQHARDFFTKLCLGVDIRQDSPLFLLRRKLVEDKQNREMRIKKEIKLALIIKAWNSYRIGNNLQFLRYSKKEKFPKIV